MKDTNTIKGTTESGFEFIVNKKNLDNMDLVDALAELGDGANLAIVKVVKLLLGESQKKKLYDHNRDADGIVPQEKINADITEIFNICQGDTAVKNS